ncbi:MULTISPECIES: hypothetical protein [unclassified Sphingomonas]|uniref:hypothetical protein n=2 Tax=Sphingomonas TaxID=13687 RepID=UPI00226AA312|nr:MULTISPECIES: hypothetical protein [unclassified Sphingomonas]
MVVTVAMVLTLGRHFDWTFFACMLPLEAGLVVWMVSLLPKVAHPPALRIDATGLTLRKGLKERTWQWCQIDAFYSQALQRGAMVGFRWKADFGNPQGTWLNYPFPGDTAAILDRLTTALAAARQAGAHSPDFSAVPQPPHAMARWKRRTNIPLAILGIVFAAFVVDLNTAGTALLTPVSPLLLSGLEMLGAGLGMLITVGMIGFQRANKDRPTPTSVLVSTTLVGGAAFVFPGAALGGYAAWRLGDITTFAGKQAPLVSKNYRIVNFGRFKQGFYAEVEPFPTAGRTRLPVSGGDFARLIAADHPYEASVYCYPVMVQVAGRAVRMVKPSFVGQQERLIASCPLKTDDHWAS